jgi:hypothetical protein
MKMQDKEFDELFRSKLDGFGAEPSAHVWDSIAGELGTARHKKTLMPFISIAASIIVLVAAGILFIPQKINVNSKPPVQNKIAKTTRLVTTTQIAKRNDARKLNEETIAVTGTGRLHPAKEIKYIQVNNSDQTIQKTIPVINESRPELASLPGKKQDLITAVVPDTDTHIALKQPMEQTSAFITKPALLATKTPVDNKQDAVPVKAKHKIRSLGDLLNVVIAKVDKRQDKFIEFTDTDDESDITGVNLGIIKIKKEK